MPHKIMLVDDEPGITKMLKLSLEATGEFEVLGINDAQSAVKLAREFCPDVMVLDILMPGLLGNEIVPLIKEVPELQQTKFIFLSALMKNNERQDISDPDAPPVLAKPVSTEKLISVIREQLVGH